MVRETRWISAVPKDYSHVEHLRLKTPTNGTWPEFLAGNHGWTGAKGRDLDGVRGTAEISTGSFLFPKNRGTFSRALLSMTLPGPASQRKRANPARCPRHTLSPGSDTDMGPGTRAPSATAQPCPASPKSPSTGMSRCPSPRCSPDPGHPT